LIQQENAGKIFILGELVATDRVLIYRGSSGSAKSMRSAEPDQIAGIGTWEQWARKYRVGHVKHHQ
jgi:hypothetical protein